MISNISISELVSTSKYTLFNNITLNSKLTFEKCIGDDLYITYKGLLNDIDIVIKLYGECSDENNEIEVLDYLQSHAIGEFPIPYISILNPKLDVDIRKLIVYQYIKGETLTPSSNIDKIMLKTDIEKQINILHKLNLVFADIRIQNIIKLEDDHYYLIDYGRVFSTIDTDLPPMNYMIEDDYIPSQQDDINKLDKIIEKY
jgi:hypothetical protein